VREADPPHAKASRHHLTPKLKGGAQGPTVKLHQICHSAIHARFSEADLARRLACVEALRAAPEMREFLDWVRTKPDDFHAPTRQMRSGGASRGGRVSPSAHPSPARYRFARILPSSTAGWSNGSTPMA
jgi:hypothetical protein